MAAENNTLALEDGNQRDNENALDNRVGENPARINKPGDGMLPLASIKSHGVQGHIPSTWLLVRTHLDERTHGRVRGPHRRVMRGASQSDAETQLARALPASLNLVTTESPLSVQTEKETMELDKLGPYNLNSIITGDAKILAREIPDESVDLIFTDPPYSREFLPLYYSIFEISARILKKDGFLLIYVGGYWKDDIMANARRHLKYFWDYIVWEPHNSPVNWPRKTICRNKSILAYTRQDSNGKALPVTQVLSVWLGGGEDKRYHIWGQDESQARYFIDCFSSPSDIVLDFCGGGGTTPAMAKALQRRYLTFEIDPATADLARQRVAQTHPPLSVPAPQQLNLLNET